MSTFANPLMLVVLPVVLICVVGGATNIFYASGLTNGANQYNTTPTFNLVCDNVGANPSPICSYLPPTGCALAPDACSLSGGTTFNPLNPTSPFTLLLSGNYLGFVKSFFGIFSASQASVSPTPVYAWSVFGAAGSNNQQGYAYCNAATAAMSYIANPISSYLYNCNIKSIVQNSYSYWGETSLCGLVGSIGGGLLCQNTPFPEVSVQLAGDPGSVTSPTTNDTFYGMSINPGNGNLGCGLVGTTGGGLLCQGAQALPLYNGATGYLIFGATITNTNFNSTYTYQFKVFYDGQSPSSVGSKDVTQALTVLGFNIAVAVLIILSLGITISIFGGNGLGSNPQGTRLAQTVGFGLLIWAPLTSEFGISWINSTILPFGLSTLLYLILTGSVFVGFYAINLIGTATSD